MSELTPESAAEVVAACQANADEAAGALGRALDGEFTLSVGGVTSYQSDAPPEGFDGPGLAMLMQFNDLGVTALLPEAGGMLPDWYANPDTSDQGKLDTLAQELSMLLVPETFMANDFKAARVENFSEALLAAEVASDAALVPIEVRAGESVAQLSLIWPLASPAGLLSAVEESVEESVEAAAVPLPAQAEQSEVGGNQQEGDFSQLPGYTQSLLRISLPVQVLLASKKETLQNVVELAAGSIIKFEKPCDEMLHLQVGDHQVAVGEAVKVGDKFGFRVSKMVLPDEHFKKVRPKQTG